MNKTSDKYCVTQMADPQPDSKPNVEHKYLSSRQIPLLAALTAVVLCIVLAAHWPALSAQAISFDDDQYLLDNRLVQNPGWASASQFLSEILKPSTVEGYYQPLAMISLMLDYAMGGRPDNLTQFHITSLSLHIINTALVIVLLYMLFGKPWPAVMIGLLFGAHPLTVEPIPWVGERKTLLASFFALWCLIIYVRYTRRNNSKLLAGCAVMYVLALMSKPTTTPLPILLLLVDFWPLRRLTKQTIMEKVPLFIIMAIFAFITVISQARAGTVGLPSESFFVRIPLILCHNIIFYLYKIIWPVNLSSHYPFPKPLSISNPMVLAGVIGTCILIPALLLSLRRTRALLTGWLIFFVAMLPTMGIIGFTNVIASDKFTYLPSIGLLMALTWLLGRLWTQADRSPVRRIIIVAFIMLLAVSESVATRRHLVKWQSTKSFYEYMLRITPNAFTLHNNYGALLLRQGKRNEAVKHYAKALQLNPNHVPACLNFGAVLVQQGKFDEAIAHFNRVLEVSPYDNDKAKAHRNLASTLILQGRLDDAIKHYAQALRFKPNWPDPMNSLAWIFATHKQTKYYNPNKAVQLAERACKLTNYRKPNILDTLAAAYAAAGRFSEAVATAEKALQLAHSKAQYQLVEEIQTHLRLYKASRPCIEPLRKVSPN